MLKTILKVIGILFVIAFAALTFAYFYFNEPEPQGHAPQKADQLAQKMMEAVNVAAWDSTKWLQWTFMVGPHHFIWDKERHLVQVNWGDKKVLLHTKTVTGKAYEKGLPLKGEAEKKAIAAAWDFFCNDSFWLNPVVKAFDAGTERTLVDWGDGKEALKVKYNSGGVTPGDAYVWLLDENYRPTAWKMWTQRLPIDPVTNSWENWQQLSTQAWVSTKHGNSMGGIELILNPKAAMDWTDLGLEADPFGVFARTVGEL